MTIMPFSDARSSLTEIVNEVAYAGKRIILTRKGKKLAAIVSLKDLEALESIGVLHPVIKKPVRRKRKQTRSLDQGKANT